MIIKLVITHITKFDVIDDHIVVWVCLHELKNYGVKLWELMLHYHLAAGYLLCIAFLQCAALVGVYHHDLRVITAKLHGQAVILHGRFQPD